MTRDKRKVQTALQAHDAEGLPRHIQQLIDVVGDIVFATDTDGFLTYVNAPIERLFGYTPDDALGKHFSAFIHPAWRDEMNAYYVRQFREHVPETTREFQILTFSGDARWIEQRVTLIFENDQVVGCCGITRDITQRKQMEARLHDSEHLFRAIIENTDDIIFIKDLNGRHVLVNPAFVKSLNSSLDNVLEKTDVELFGLADGEHYRAIDQTVMMSGQTNTYDVTCEIEGVEREYSFVKFPLHSYTGEIRGVVGIGRDITQRKHTEEMTRASEERFRKLAEMTAALIFVSREQYQLVYANLALAAATGYTLDELFKLSVFDLIHPEEHEGLQERLRNRRDDKPIADHYELRLKRKDGTACWIDLALNIISLNGVQVLVGTGLDITQRKQVEKQLRESQQHFLEYLKAVNEINIELSEVESFDDMCRHAIELGRSRLQFDRLALLMLDPVSGEVLGTFGTDANGNLRDERAIRVSKHNNFSWVLEALTEKRRVRVWQDTPLYDNWEVVGKGWNAMAVLLNGEEIIGWLAADNLTQQQPLQDYQLELLSLYAATLEHLCIRKRNEEALRTSEERYRAVVEDQTEFICRYLPDTRLNFVNEAQCRYYNKIREQMIGESFLNDIPVGYHPAILDHIRQSTITRQPFTYQHPVYHTDGGLRWQEWTDRPIFDEAGNLIEFQAVGRDIEENRRAEAERSDYISRLEIIQQLDTELTEKLDFNYVLKIALDAAVRISHAQSGVIHLLEGDGLRVAQVIGNFPGSVPGSTLTLNQGIVGRVARNLTPELVLDVRRDADYIPNLTETRAQMTLPLVSQDRLIGVLNVQTSEVGQFTSEMFDFLKLLAAHIASALDNARLHQQTEQQLDELKTLYQQVSDLEQTKTQMIRIAAHDLRNPLGIISGFLQMLSDALAPHMTADNHEQIDAIKEGVNRIDKITRDILTLERISSGQEMMAERVDIRQIVEAAYADARPQAQLKKQACRLELPDEPLYVRGDRFLLPETISNLMTNAIKYTPEGGQVTARLTVENLQAVFVVEDNGYGIPANQQPHLFQPFYRVKLKETRSVKGTGLGLHLVKSVIERHNGQMRFESEYGKGSTFGFALPLIQEATTPRKRPKKTAP